MKLYIIALIVVLNITKRNCQSFRPSMLEMFLPQFNFFRNNLYGSLGRNSEDSENMRKARSLNMLQTPVPYSQPFPCNVTGHRSLKPPTDVNLVRPGDIDIIAALGDSLTAGNGLVATDLMHVLVENRGLAWSIGGQGTWREYLTLPNILKMFNPDLFGFSLRDSMATERDSQFNVAAAAAISSEVPFMTKVLIKRIAADPRVNLKQHWKLITLLIGANDFCLDMCYYNQKEVLNRHRKDLLAVLRLLRDNLPRTIVNLVPPPDVRLVTKLTNKPETCVIQQMECYCFLASRYKNLYNTFSDTIEKWRRIDEEVAALPEFQQQDFAVNFQPFLLNITLPMTKENKFDFSYSSLDCFHPSQKFGAQLANSLWNNMLEKHGNKTDRVTPLFEKFLCPSEDQPYIFTYKNSNL